MSRDRFRSRGGGGGGFHRRGGGGGRGGLHDFRSPPPGMGLNQNRGPMGPVPGPGGPKPQIPPPPPHQQQHQQQQQPPPQQPPPQQPPPLQPPPRRGWVGGAAGLRGGRRGSASGIPGEASGLAAGGVRYPSTLLISVRYSFVAVRDVRHKRLTRFLIQSLLSKETSQEYYDGFGSLMQQKSNPYWTGNIQFGEKTIASSYLQRYLLPTWRGTLYLKVSFLLYQGFKANLSLLRRPGEKTYTQRCRLFVGNLPADITEDEFKRLFAKYGEPGEVFINKGKGFGFIKLESRALAEIAKAELDDTPMRGRQLRVRFATHAAALSVRNLSPYVSNELLEEAFSQFGPIERAVVIVDDRGRSTGKGIVEFASKPAARKAFERCSEGVFLLTTTPRPVIVEPLEQLDDEDGLPEKLAQKNPMYQKERETPPRFAQHGTFEYEYSQRWKSLDEMEKQQREQVEKNMKDAKDKLESEMEDAYHEHQANLLRQDLMRRQEELRRMEELHNQEMQKRKEMQLRQEEERRRREEEMMIRQREMEEQMRRQREESYSRMGYMDPRERDMRMGGGGAMNMGDPYGSGGQKFPPLGGGGGIGYEANPGVPPATMSGSMMGSDMRTERFGQGGAGPVGGQGPRGMGPGTPAGYGRGREEYEGPNKKPRF
ncbi:hypothetical protein K5549_009096 [Capra hircus]|nr:hypothetical protein K5549_009096 [Capra hircus]